MIKAIETKYKGYNFRSRLEARWAVFLDTLGIKWRYEVEGYDLGELGYYLPDFVVTGESGESVFLEVKGEPIYYKNGVTVIPRGLYTPNTYQKLLDAHAAARSARFEHGANPQPRRPA